MRELLDHKVNPANDTLAVFATDAPDPQSFACHRYAVMNYDARTNPAAQEGDPVLTSVILFQNGPIAQVGVNGLTHEALLAIVADRLRGFQEGPYKCRENALALTKLEEAMHWLQQRTISRMRRGVEGTHAI